MSDEFDGRVVVVTGAAGNLGSAVCEAFERTGARVAAVHRRGGGNAGTETPGDSGSRFTIAADVTDAASAKAAGDAAFARWGRIDVLCNVVGAFTMGSPAHATPDDVWLRMFEVNVLSVVHMSAVIVPRMIAAGRGAIVNVSAASSGLGRAGMAPYAVAKNGVARLSESMAVELLPHGISVSCVMPTTIDTPENRTAMPAADRRDWETPSEIAAVIMRVVAKAPATVLITVP